MTTYTYDSMLEAPTKQLGDGYRLTRLVLSKGDIAPSCCSTKYNLRATEHTVIEYLISPWGIQVSVTEGRVGRAYTDEYLSLGA